MNRFNQPLQSPTNVQPFRLPFEQMVQTLGIAEQQQEQSRQGIFEILDFEFPYIPTESNQMAYETIKEDINGGVDNLLKDNTGDLRGLKGNILNMQRGLKSRATKADGDIYKLASDYARYQSWQKDNEEVSKKDPYRYAKYKNEYLTKLEESGGSLVSGFNGEQVMATPNWSEKVKSYTGDIKANVIKRAQSKAVGINIVSYEEALKYVTPEEVMQIAAGYLQGDPEVMNYFSQDIRHNFMTQDDAKFIISETGQNNKVINRLNPNNPAAPAIMAAMAAQGFTESSRSDSVTPNATLYQMKKDAADQQLMVNSYGITPANHIDNTKKSLELAIESGDPVAIQQAMKAAEANPHFQSMIQDLQKDPRVIKYYENNKSKLKDDSDNQISLEDYAKAVAMSGGKTTGLVSALQSLDYNISPNSIGTSITKIGGGISDFLYNNIFDWVLPDAVTNQPNFYNAQNIYEDIEANYLAKNESGMTEVFGYHPVNNKAYDAQVKFHIGNNGANLYLPGGGTNINTYLQKEAKGKDVPKLQNIEVSKDRDLATGRHQLIATYKYKDGTVGTVIATEATTFSPLSDLHDQQSTSAKFRGNNAYGVAGDIEALYSNIGGVNTNARSGDVYVDKVPHTSNVSLVYHKDDSGLWVVPKINNKIVTDYKMNPKDASGLKQELHLFLQNNKLFKQ